MSDRSGGGRFPPEAARVMSLAFEFAGAVVLFWLLGRAVDNWLGIEPWGQVAGSVVGWTGGVLHVYYGTRGRDVSASPAVRPASGGSTTRPGPREGAR